MMVFLPIKRKGMAKLYENIDLKFILHVPKLTCNFLSMSNLSKDSNSCVNFYNSQCIFQDQSLAKIIGNARIINRLYYFNDNSSGLKQA